jgi:hypothetical protein
MSKIWEVVYYSKREFDPETGYYIKAVQCGHKHATKASAKACLNRLNRTTPRCKTCEWTPNLRRVCATCSSEVGKWFGCEARPVNDPNRPRKRGFVPPVTHPVHEPERRMFHTDAEIEAWAAEQRRQYAAGDLCKWQIDALEKTEGWSWNGAKPRKMTKRAKAEDIMVRAFA